MDLGRDAQALAKLGLLLGALSLSCDASSQGTPSEADTTSGGNAGGTGGGNAGGTGGDDSGGNSGHATSSTTASRGGAATASTTTGDGGGAAGAAGDAGAGAGAAGAGGTGGGSAGPGRLTCESFSDEDPRHRCEPKLRALLMRHDDTPWVPPDDLLRDRLRTFEYDEAGRISTVGDGRNHGEYFLHRYSYDNEGRLTRFEDRCDEEGTCPSYELAYAGAGWLQTTTRSDGERTTYGEDGRVLERLRGSWGTSYFYRSDGQVDFEVDFLIDAGGVRTTEETVYYEYGDDDLLDSVSGGDYAFRYVIEGGRVRVKSVDDDYFPYDLVYDDLGRRAFIADHPDGEEHAWFIVADNVEPGFHHPFARFLIRFPERTFPYQPLALTPNDINDFSYQLEARGISYDIERRVRFSKEGLLEHLKCSMRASSGEFEDPSIVELEVLRCGSVTIESVDWAGSDWDDQAIVYYYGCDDFVLPAPLPTL